MSHSKIAAGQGEYTFILAIWLKIRDLAIGFKMLIRFIPPPAHNPPSSPTASPLLWLLSQTFKSLQVIEHKIDIHELIQHNSLLLLHIEKVKANIEKCCTLSLHC